MTKEFKHEGYNFTIEVTLNFGREKSLNGQSLHKVTVKSNDFDYSSAEVVRDSDLMEYVQKAESVAKICVDKEIKKQTPLDSRLAWLGFK